MYRVVLAEDEFLVRQGLVSMVGWERLGMQVVFQASNGKEALEAIEVHSPHILITDIRMPIIDGIELIQAVRKTNSQIKIVILTCVDDFSFAQRAMELGVSSYILKLTADIKEIESVLEKICCSIKDDNKRITNNLSAQWLLREQLCQDFICRRILSDESFKAFFDNFSSALPTKTLCLIRLQLPFENVLLQKEVTGKKFKEFLQGIVKGIFALYGVGEIFFDLDNNAVLLLGFGEMSIIDATALRSQILDETKGSIKHFLGIPVLLGISEFADSYTSLPKLYHEAGIRMRENTNKIYPPKLTAVIGFLKEHFCENISLQDAADFVNVTPNYLSKLFAQAELESFTTLLNKLRVAKAKALLRNPACPVYRVGEQIGFPNSTYFIRVFKKHTGVTPHEYRCQPKDGWE